jgi:tRNA G37 N-methylase TrmD
MKLKINEWRFEQSLQRTAERRPNLTKSLNKDEESK